ncbi:DUF2306 domain-containing protein [Granulicella tundricola]|uniref:DUF2306 domain-containing protein n=1 Tax=Granulicella tundricola (strain ATCC BAA-1859 / DSM 23138 / MP5ACTX9) TaxID=1198114 RepID=E8X6M1_GRATM|nr:DUF2306 domain-containing protein [Granulicella tundricola]ADW71171.1 hypothetical protein AciX9_3893 [Granulicella tundricola MP5ACTX9]
MQLRTTAIRNRTPSPPPARNWAKFALWAMIGVTTLSVTLYSEVPLLHQAKERAYLGAMPFLIVPHIACGIFALLSGPLQFSTRLRQRHLQFHRLLGRVYVSSVLVAAPLAMVLSNQHHDRRAIHFVVANCCQASTWLIATAAAFLTARNGHIQQHKEWMVRSYAVTLTFVGTRVLQPLPAWNRHSEAGFAMEIIMITFLAILVPDIAFHWRQLTTRRLRSGAAIPSMKDQMRERRGVEKSVSAASGDSANLNM